jgi:hypothetical protein
VTAPDDGPLIVDSGPVTLTATTQPATSNDPTDDVQEVTGDGGDRAGPR